MLEPKRSKHRKMQKGRRRGRSKGATKLDFGEFGLLALESGWLTARQIEAARIAITRHMQRRGKLWFRVFPDKPITKKPAETRMGKGKGALDHWVAVVKPGRIICELEGVSEKTARECLALASHKLPIKTKLTTREV
jgi:large subunit ribosomal protein L16